MSLTRGELLRTLLRFEKGMSGDGGQVQFSLLSCGPEQAETKAICDELGIALIAYSPLGLGMLTGKYGDARGLPQGPRGLLFRQILPGLRPLLDLMGDIAARRRATIPQVALSL